MYISLVNESNGIYALMTNIVIVESPIQIIMVATTVLMHNNMYVAM